MNLERLRALPSADQRVFLLGRITAETTNMDAALRFVHASLRGKDDMDAFLDAPDYVSTNVKACRKLLAERSDLSEEAAHSIRQTLKAVSETYTRRNRFIHDLLRASVLDDTWELVRLTRQEPDQPTEKTISLEDTIRLVCEIVGVTWRLRGAAQYVRNGTWRGTALGHVVGEWDGSAFYTH